MLLGMLDAARGGVKEELRMDIISNNLANSNVIGFKRDKISFQDMLKNVQARDADKMKALGKEALIQIHTDLMQGDVHSTGNAMDFAIEGPGFLKVLTPDGVRYTRKGNMSLDSQGYLITQEGFRILGNGGPISIPDGDVFVDDEGRIRVDGQEAGQMALVDFANPKLLEKTGLGLFRNLSPDKNPETPVAPETRLKQGYVELSNVDVMEEIVDMIHCLRAFESYQKAMQVLDGIDNKVINDVAKLR